MIDVETPRILAYIGGMAAIVGGLTSIVAKKPLISILLGLAGVNFVPIEGGILLVLGFIGLIGGIAAIYFATRGDGAKAMIGGVLGLLAPCGLSILAIIGGYLMSRQQ